MKNQDIQALNDVTETLIDSCKGYEQCIEMSDDTYALQNAFRTRQREREELISQFQSQVRAMGGEPRTDGSVGGTLHRNFAKFTSAFRDDERAAIEAVDTGEEHLVETIDNALKQDGLSPQSQTLLQKAKTSAHAGERLADQLESAD